MTNLSSTPTIREESIQCRIPIISLSSSAEKNNTRLDMINKFSVFLVKLLIKGI